ncbi:MAG: nuclear transport factor 2 family protein, partial [Gammaproteobacteria bacterium]|nr:nuclear transport factor 2 family protein [Gammaproteobacteria bacterium]
MHPMHHGREAIHELWRKMFDQQFKIDITVTHLQWIEQGDVAIHLLEELVIPIGSTQRQPPIYASNVYHRDETGWHLLLHLNSPAPPPAGVLPPIPGGS